MNRIFMLVVILTLIVFIGCEGDMGPEGPRGPAGPSTILAFGDIDWTFSVGFEPLAFGPLNRVDSVTVVEIVEGRGTVSCWGTFPDETGTLIVSGSSDETIAPNITVTGTILSWGDTLITFNVQTWNTSTQVYDGDDFSFVIFGE